MRAITLLAFSAVTLSLAGCLSPSLPDGGSAIIPPIETSPDTCGRELVEPFVGGSVDLIPAALLGTRSRVYETGSMLTMDYRFDRINVEFDPVTRDVVRVSCG